MLILRKWNPKVSSRKAPGMMVSSLGAIVLLAALAISLTYADRPEQNRPKLSAVERAKQRQKLIETAAESFLKSDEGEDKKPQDRSRILMNLSNKLADESHKHDLPLSSNATRSPSRKVENEVRAELGDLEPESSIRRTTVASGQAASQPQVQHWSAEYIDPVTGARTSSSKTTTTVHQSGGYHHNQDKLPDGTGASSGSLSSSTSASSSSFYNSRGQAGEQATATIGSHQELRQPFDDYHSEHLEHEHEQEAEREHEDGRQDANDKESNEHLEEVESHSTAQLMDENEILSPNGSEHDLYLNNDLEEPVYDHVNEHYIDHSDPYNPKEVRVEKKTKSRVGPNSVEHEHHEIKTSNSLGGTGSSHSSTSMKRSFSSSSISSNSGGSTRSAHNPFSGFHDSPTAATGFQFDPLRIGWRQREHERNGHRGLTRSTSFHFPAAPLPPLAPLPVIPSMLSAGRQHNFQPFRFVPFDSMHNTGAWSSFTGASALAGSAADYDHPAFAPGNSELPSMHNFGDFDMTASSPYKRRL